MFVLIENAGELCADLNEYNEAEGYNEFEKDRIDKNIFFKKASFDQVAREMGEESKKHGPVKKNPQLQAMHLGNKKENTSTSSPRMDTVEKKKTQKITQ